MIKYSGRTTDHAHKFGNWKSKKINPSPALKKILWFDVQWSDCPVEVEEDVKQLWRDYELGNDHYFVKFNEEIAAYWEEGGKYPVLLQYLRENNVKECYIHWWW